MAQYIIIYKINNVHYLRDLLGMFQWSDFSYKFSFYAVKKAHLEAFFPP